MGLRPKNTFNALFVAFELPKNVVNKVKDKYKPGETDECLIGEEFYDIKQF